MASGTPRFPTEEEIDAEEKRLLLSFAFKDEEEIERYRREMIFIINQEHMIDKPPSSKFKGLRNELKSK